MIASATSSASCSRFTITQALGGRLHQHRGGPMSEPSGRGYKTLAVRLPDELHAQLVLIAGLADLSLNDAIRQAVEEMVDRRRGDGDLAAQAAKVLEEMEQEAAAKRSALQALLGPAPTPTAEPHSEAPSRGRTKRTEPEG
jgi:hypothetical protein